MFSKQGGSIWLGTLLLMLLQTAHSGVYRWTDADGKVHFGDHPPVVQEAEQVATPKAAPAARPAENSVSRQESRKRLLEQYDKERDDKRQAVNEKREERARRKQRCVMVKDQLRNYQRYGRIYELQADGERRYFSSEEREQGLAKLKGEVKQWCD